MVGKPCLIAAIIKYLIFLDSLQKVFHVGDRAVYNGGTHEQGEDCVQ